MSHSTKSNGIFGDFCNLYFETKKVLYMQQSCDSKHKGLLEKVFDSDEEGINDLDEDFIYPKTKGNTEDINKTKPRSKAKTKTEDLHQN